MPIAKFRFYAELNDFLPKERQRIDFKVFFKGHETVKHLVESLGVPHTEVDVILVNKHSVDFSARISDGDWVDIYPSTEIFSVDSIIHLQPKNTYEPLFILDGHLGKLASYLRLLGFDTLYQNVHSDVSL